MRFRRLRDMGIAELASRSRQEVSKRLERAGLLGPRAPWVQLTAPVEPVPFFEGAVSGETSALLARRLPGARQELLASAEALLGGRFDLLGHRGLDFGDPMDWHLDPTTGRRAPLVHWSRLDSLDAVMVGDSKVVWELNRHHWLVRLGQAYRLTADERYAAASARYVREWLQANPPGLGINWVSSLEVALRLIAWGWLLHLLRGSAALTPALVREMRTAMVAHAAHVARYLSYYFSPNTHLTGEALGLVYAGLLLPEHRQAARWRALGAGILVREAERQVFPDGVYFEQSVCYQRYTVDIYLHLLALGARAGLPRPRGIGERVERMLDFLLALRRPDGSMPQIGDADGGRLLPLAPRVADDFRDLFSTAAALFGRTDYAWAAGALAPETVWLLGPGGASAFEALVPAPPAGAPSRCFREGGYVVMRSGWEARAHQFVFDAGPLGCPMSAAHGHADLLSVQCAAFGEPFLVDPGTYGYAEPAWRDHFRGTAAHSTVTVDGQGQAVPAGPFRWQRSAAARLHRWQSDEVYDFADASHDAYGRLEDPVAHRRRVLFVKPRYWVVVDDLAGAAEHAVAVRFQLASMPVAVGAAQWARAGRPGGPGLLIRSFSTAPLKCEVHEGELAPIQGWVSPDYGRRQPAPLVSYSTVAQLPVRIISLLVPAEDLGAAPPAVVPIAGDGGLAGFRLGDEVVRFDGRSFTVGGR